MLNFSIMPLFEEHIEEVCADITEQVKSGVATMPLFMFALTPEWIPAIDKADQYCRIYEKYKERLEAHGIPSGVLIQASIGHGWILDAPASFQKYVGLSDGKETQDIYCPFDLDFQEYMRSAGARIAQSKPAHIMLDDDYRLMGGRPAHGCACPLHLNRLEKDLGYPISREALWEAICRKETEEDLRLRDGFIKTQLDSLIECAKELRRGIDSVDPTIPGSYCLCHTGEAAYEIASIMAGEGNPIVIRLNNAHYCAEDPRSFLQKFHRSAAQISSLPKKPDIFLAETDTCPQNRYSTPAAKLHSHFTLSILEGMDGAKHWITRLESFEPESGIAYRQKLSKYQNFYHELARISRSLEWIGCKIPVPPRAFFTLGPKDASIADSNGWCGHILDRFGLPMHFGNDGEGAFFFDGSNDLFFTDEEILKFLSGNMVLDANAAKSLCKRGFAKYIGVEVKERKPDSLHISGESFYPEGKSDPQFEPHELIPLYDEVQRCSEAYHLREGKHREILFPSVTAYRNQLGGFIVVYSGITTFPFKLATAFGFLNQTRKAQLVRLLKEMDALPIYYPDDAEVYLEAARTEDGELLCALLDTSLDEIENFPLITKEPIRQIKQLTADGRWKAVSFDQKGERTLLHLTAYPYDPIILKIK